MQKLLLLLIFTIPFLGFSQDNPCCPVNKEFLLIHSSKDYKSALITAKKAAKSLNIKLDLRELSPVPDSLGGLSFPYYSCKSIYEDIETKDTTCYFARGKLQDDGEYISIEYSSAYKGFAEGYYIVVVSSEKKGNKNMQSLLTRVKSKFTSAYIKSSIVSMCCF